jgi:hypothetical protein
MATEDEHIKKLMPPAIKRLRIVATLLAQWRRNTSAVMPKMHEAIILIQTQSKQLIARLRMSAAWRAERYYKNGPASFCT